MICRLSTYLWKGCKNAFPMVYYMDKKLFKFAAAKMRLQIMVIKETAMGK
jgi:hypothetical protein